MGSLSRLFLGFSLTLAFSAAHARGMTVEPNPIEVGARFDGSTVRIAGFVDRDSRVFVIITGAEIEEKFNQKGRIGPLWANVRTLHISGVPGLFLTASSAPGTEGLDRRMIDNYLLDLEAVSRRAIVDPLSSDTTSLRRDYMKLKQSQGVFYAAPGAVQTIIQDGRVGFAASIPWPVSASAGVYNVDVIQVKSGSIWRKDTSTLQVKLVGLPRLISFLAFERSRLYGALSVSSALFVGLLMGLVFKRGAGH